MRNLSEKEIEKYADKVRGSLKDLTPLEKHKVFQKMGANPRSEEDGFFDDVDFDVDIGDL